jgi:hypothetical protein
MVAGAIAAGNLETVVDYCTRDVVATSYLYLRYQLLRGQLDVPGYQIACSQLKALWAPKIPRWVEDSEFVNQAIDFTRLELR